MYHACLGNLTAPRTVGQPLAHLGVDYPSATPLPAYSPRGERGWQRSFLVFPAHLHTSKGEPQGGGSERDPRRWGRRVVVMHGTHGWGATDIGFCSGSRSAGQRRGPTVPDGPAHGTYCCRPQQSLPSHGRGRGRGRVARACWASRAAVQPSSHVISQLLRYSHVILHWL